MELKPIMTRKEVLELLNMENRMFSVYVGRKSILLDRNKHIDTSIRQNRDWLESMYLKRKNKALDPPKPKLDRTQLTESENSSLADVELQLKRKDVELKTQRIKNLKVQEQKLTGELIPFKDVMKTVPAYVNQFKSRIYQSGENLLLEVMNVAGFSSTDITTYKTRWRNEVNSATSESVEDVKNMIDAIIAENSIKEEVDL
jgi:hypothetical protein